MCLTSDGSIALQIRPGRRLSGKCRGVTPDLSVCVLSVFVLSVSAAPSTRARPACKATSSRPSAIYLTPILSILRGILACPGLACPSLAVVLLLWPYHYSVVIVVGVGVGVGVGVVAAAAAAAAAQVPRRG